MLTAGNAQELVQVFPAGNGAKWKAAKVNIGLGIDWAEYRGMAFDELMDFATEAEKMKRDLTAFTEDARTTTGGAALNVSIGLHPLNVQTGTYRNDRELRLGMGLYSEKEAMVSFKNQELDTSIVYCNLHSELALDAAYLFTGRWGKRWEWLLGMGGNAGFTFDNQMVLMSGHYFEEGAHPSTQENLSEERFSARNVYYLRAYLTYGIYYYLLPNTAIGLEGRKGRGLQLLEDEQPKYMRRAGALALGLRIGI